MTLVSFLYLATVLVFLSVFVGLCRLLKLSETPTLTLCSVPVSASVSLAAEAEAEAEAEEESEAEAEVEGSPSRSLGKYDVFLSFRGPDVRKTFVCHLDDALKNEGIKTFHDDRDLQRGKLIWKGLDEAMIQSRYAIVVISEGYPTSRWCLEELSVMVELVEKKRLELIPIFYDIDPSDLKRRSECFNEAFEKHELRYDQETVGRWRRAFSEVGNISGWESKSRFIVFLNQ